jgi:hypothetical protein
MATSRPFAYNAGSPIGSNEQKGNLAIGPTGPTASYSDKPGNVQWWNGPDEDLGYVIAQGVSNQPNPAGIQAKVGFFRTAGKTDGAFVELASVVAGQNFASGVAALNWINSNDNYWTSFNAI